jgi:hypothetical protein
MKFKMVMMVITLLVIGVVMPMLMPGPDGKPMMTWRDWLPDTSKLNAVVGKAQEIVYDANELVSEKAGISVGAERPKLYKWKDEHGNWHFSDQASPTALDQVVEALPQATNSMSPPPVINFGEQERAASRNAPNLPLPTTVPLDKIPKLIEDAKNVQKLADDRAKQFSKL